MQAFSAVFNDRNTRGQSTFSAAAHGRQHGARRANGTYRAGNVEIVQTTPRHAALLVDRMARIILTDSRRLPRHVITVVRDRPTDTDRCLGAAGRPSVRPSVGRSVV